MITTTAHAVREVLHRALSDDPAVRLLGDDLSRAGGVAGTTSRLAEVHGADRVIDLPISERGAAGFALGLALSGLRPVLHLTSTGRLVAVLEALGAAGSAVANGFKVPLIVRVPYGDEAPGLDAAIGPLLDTTPGFTVACGASPGQVAGLLQEALRRDHPVILLEPRALYARGADVDAGHDQLVARAPFAPRTLRAGDAVTLAAWGLGVDAAMEAADRLAEAGVSVEVIDLVVLSPLDAGALGASVRRTGRLVVVGPDDPAVVGRVHRVAADEAFLSLEAPLAAAPPRTDAVIEAANGSVGY